MPVRFSRKGNGRQRTSQFKLKKLVMFLAMTGARLEKQFLAAPSFFGLAIAFFSATLLLVFGCPHYAGLLTGLNRFPGPEALGNRSSFNTG